MSQDTVYRKDCIHELEDTFLYSVQPTHVLHCYIRNIKVYACIGPYVYIEA